MSKHPTCKTACNNSTEHKSNQLLITLLVMATTNHGRSMDHKCNYRTQHHRWYSINNVQHLFPTQPALKQYNKYVLAESRHCNFSTTTAKMNAIVINHIQHTHSKWQNFSTDTVSHVPWSASHCNCYKTQSDEYIFMGRWDYKHKVSTTWSHRIHISYLLIHSPESARVSRRRCRLPSRVCDKATADKDFCCSLWVEMWPMVLRKTDFHDELIKQDPAGAFPTAFQMQNTIPKTRKHAEWRWGQFCPTSVTSPAGLKSHCCNLLNTITVWNQHVSNRRIYRQSQNKGVRKMYSQLKGTNKRPSSVPIKAANFPQSSSYVYWPTALSLQITIHYF